MKHTLLRPYYGALAAAALLMTGCGLETLQTNENVADEQDDQASISAASLRPCSDLSEKCEGPQCEPTLLVSEPGRSVQAMVQHGNHLFYLSCVFQAPIYALGDQCQLKRASKGIGKTKLLVSDLGWTTGGIAADASNIYIPGRCQLDRGCQILKYNKRAGSLDVLVDYSNLWLINNVRADSTHLYWAGDEKIDGVYSSVVQRVALQGGAVETLISRNTRGGFGGADVTPTHLVDLQGPNILVATGQLRKMSKQGTELPVVLFKQTELYATSAIASDDRFIYTMGNGRWDVPAPVFKTPIEGGDTVEIVSIKHDYRPGSGIVADGRGNLVWTAKEYSATAKTRIAKMYVGQTGKTVELIRGLATEAIFTTLFEAAVIDSKSVYFSASIPAKDVDVANGCSPGKYCHPDGAIYKAPLCAP